MKDRYVIWSNNYLDIDDGWREAYAEFLEINNLDKDPDNEDAIYEYMVDTNWEYLDDERANLGKIQFDTPILLIADVGLWDHREDHYKEIVSGKITDCLQFGRDIEYATWYVDMQGDLRCDGVHHDGTNHYLYRAIKEDATEEQIEDLKDKIYEGAVTSDDVEAITHRLGDEICKVYGWEFPAHSSGIEDLSNNAYAGIDQIQEAGRDGVSHDEIGRE